MPAISQSIVNRLEQGILDGTLTPGKKIPSERQLSARLGVSRAIIREALKELRGKKVIETRHGQGSFVTGMVQSIDKNSALAQLFKDHPRTLYDLLEVRETLEGQAAYLAAERGSDADLYCITKAFKAMEQASSATGNSHKMAELDHAFHHRIYEASHNPVLVHVLQSLTQLMLNSVLAAVNNLYHRRPEKQQIDRHHQQIYYAVISRQPDWARNAATRHIRHVRESLRDIEREDCSLIRAEIWDSDTTS